MENLSIHPRVKARSDKVNTCKPRSAQNGGQGGKPLRRVLERLSARLKDWEKSVAEAEPKMRNAWPKPGSMKP